MRRSKSTMKKRRFIKNALNHCYQRSVNGFLLFYTITDYLVYFTIVCTAATKYNVRIIKVCPMPDHVHLSCFCKTVKSLSAFMRYVNSLYAREFNRICHREGELFQGTFGSAPKVTDKDIRSNLIYVDNNPPERYLCRKSEEYRWNFLAYATNNHPFSDKIVKRKATSHLKHAMDEVVATKGKGRFMPHAMISRLFSKLDNSERNSLVDYIITTYSVIDYNYSINIFGSYEAMILAEHSTRGKEFDIDETFNGKRDDVYARMSNILLSAGLVDDIHQVVSKERQEKERLFLFLLGKTKATTNQIDCFLHIPPRCSKKQRKTK